MKTLDTEKTIRELEENELIKIDPAFLQKSTIDVPIVKQVDRLLAAVGEKGLKLTPKGNLPTKVVKELTLCCPTPADTRFHQWVKRFLENEQVPAMRARVVSEVGNLVKVSKGKLHYGRRAEAYLRATDAEKFLYLFETIIRVNLGYFDRMQDAPLINGVANALLQIVRDRVDMFREPEVYVAFLMEEHPWIPVAVEEEIEPETYQSDDPFDTFEALVKIRLFQNFFAPFGLVQERGTGYPETYECQKTALLDALLIPLDAIDMDAVLNRKRLHDFAQRMKKESIDTDLFDAMSYIHVQGARYPLKPAETIADELIARKRFIGTRAERAKAFYTDLAYAAEQTLRYFTRLEVKGGGSRGDEMHRNFRSFIDGLSALLPHDRPYNLLEAMRAASFHFIDILVNVYGVDTFAKDPIAEYRRHFDEEAVEDISTMLFVMADLERKGSKFKRINKRMEAMVKEALTTFVLAVMSIHTDRLDQA